MAVGAFVLQPAIGAEAAGSVTAPAAADTFVTAANPTAKNGRATTARVDDTPKIAYFKFTLTGVPTGAPVAGASLVLTGVGTQKSQTVAVFSVGNTWTENTTYATRPTLGVRVADGSIGNRVVQSFPVPVSGNGTYSFAVVRTTVGGDNILATRENSTTANRPRLVVAYGDVPPPPAACADGLDNDADTLTDYPADPGCTATTDTDETDPLPPPAACADGLDNDADTLTDYPADPGCTATTDTDETDPLPVNPWLGYLAYSPSSFFRTPLPTTDVPVAADSDAGIAFHVANEPFPYPKIRGVGGNGWGVGFGIATCSDPVFTIASTGAVPASQQHLKDVGFHAPLAALIHLPANSDAPLVVIDRCGTSARPNGLTVWAANVRYDGTTVLQSSGRGTITAGSFAHDTNGLDRRNPHSDSALNERSRGAIPDAMVLRNDLLSAALDGANGGTLGHVLHLFSMATNTTAGFVSPMVAAETGKRGYGAEGQRIRVKEAWVAPVDCAGPGLVIARTLQRYGAYLGDNSGSGSGLKAEQGSMLAGLTQDALAPCVTWSDFEYIEPGWGA